MYCKQTRSLDVTVRAVGSRITYTLGSHNKKLETGALTAISSFITDQYFLVAVKLRKKLDKLLVDWDNSVCAYTGLRLH